MSDFHDHDGRDLAARRRFIRLLGLGAGAAMFGAAGQPARAADLPKVNPKEPVAAALGYVENAANVDAKKYPQHKPEQICGNCQLFTKQPKSAYGPCTLFPGKVVAEKGWCASWIKKS